MIHIYLFGTVLHNYRDDLDFYPGDISRRTSLLGLLEYTVI